MASKFKNPQPHTRILMVSLFLGLRLTFSNTVNHQCVAIFEIHTNWGCFYLTILNEKFAVQCVEVYERSIMTKTQKYLALYRDPHFEEF